LRDQLSNFHRNSSPFFLILNPKIYPTRIIIIIIKQQQQQVPVAAVAAAKKKKKKLEHNKEIYFFSLTLFSYLNGVEPMAVCVCVCVWKTQSKLFKLHRDDEEEERGRKSQRRNFKCELGGKNNFIKVSFSKLQMR
jgi:hypothetical protein